MKVTLYMAISANGMAAKTDDNVDWVSEESWESYLQHVNQAGCAVVGRRTYEMMEDDEFSADCFYVVLTTKPFKSGRENVLVTDRQPAELIQQLGEKGHNEVCIVGGGKLNASFLKANLVDKIILDVEPIIFAQGINLVDPSEDFETNLELTGTQTIGKNTVQLRYRVIK